MKKTIFTLLFLSSSLFAFSQLTPQEYKEHRKYVEACDGKLQLNQIALTYQEGSNCGLAQMRTDNFNQDNVNAVVGIKDGSKEPGAYLVLGKSYNAFWGKKDKDYHSDMFAIEYLEDGSCRLYNGYTKLYVTVQDSKQFAGAELVQDVKKNDDSQVFKLVKISGAGDSPQLYHIESSQGYKLGLWKATRAWGTHIRLTDASYGHTVKWVLKGVSARMNVNLDSWGKK